MNLDYKRDDIYFFCTLLDKIHRILSYKLWNLYKFEYSKEMKL